MNGNIDGLNGLYEVKCLRCLESKEVTYFPLVESFVALQCKVDSFIIQHERNNSIRTPISLSDQTHLFTLFPGPNHSRDSVHYSSYNLVLTLYAEYLQEWSTATDMPRSGSVSFILNPQGTKLISKALHIANFFRHITSAKNKFMFNLEYKGRHFVSGDKRLD